MTVRQATFEVHRRQGTPEATIFKAFANADAVSKYGLSDDSFVHIKPGMEEDFMDLIVASFAIEIDGRMTKSAKRVLASRMKAMQESSSDTLIRISSPA